MTRSLRQKIDLLRLLTRKEITLKYKRTYFGFLWSLLNPLLTAIVLFFAFKVIMRFKMDDYALFLLTALFPWTWFAASVTMSANALTSNVSLLKKLVFPKHFLIIALILGQLVNLLFAIPVIFMLGLFYGKMPSMEWIIGIPILIIVQFMVIYGVSLAVSMINAFFRDMEHLVSVVVNMLFWMTPIIYPLEAIPEKYRVLLSLNPIMYLVDAWRELLLHNRIKWDSIGISALTALFVLAAGIYIFHKMEDKLDEVL